MCDAYREAARRVGTSEAQALASELCAWHTRMISHQRTLARLGVKPNHCGHSDECAHGLARELWVRAQAVFWRHSSGFTFLSESAGA
jgi:hypothetical protein